MLIAICDDNPNCIKKLEHKIKDYFTTHAEMAEKPEIYTFQSGLDILESFTLRKYEIIFLDIDMPGINGMELAARIRQIDKQVQITFITYMEDQIPFGYRVKASGFVIKPFTQDHINSVMDDMMAWLEAGHRQPLEIKLKGGGSAWIETQEIMYIESFRHYVEAVTKEGRRFDFLGKISHMENMLAEHHFVRLHRSYLVNLAYVFIRNTDSVRLTSGNELPMGRLYADKFISSYVKYRRENG